jgi:hypothetical protein
MLLEKRNNNMYGIWVGISTGFEIFNNFPFLGSRVETNPPGAIYTK